MVISLSCFGASAETYDKAETVTLDNYKEKIVEAVVESENITADNIEVISLDNGSAKSANPEMAIRIYDETGAMTLIPQVIVNDELVNSFAYVKSALMAKSQDFNTTHLSDLTLHFYAGYNKITMSNLLLAFRPTSMYFYWTSNNSSVSISNISVSFESYGQYWNVNTAQYLNTNRRCVYSVTKSSPSKNNAYYGSTSLGIASGYGIVCTTYPDHAGILSYNMSYKVNGANRSDSHNFLLYDNGGEHSAY